MSVHAEIEYVNVDGAIVHSDICPPDCDLAMATPEYREFLHNALNEWLNNSNGSGIFYIGNLPNG